MYGGFLMANEILYSEIFDEYNKEDTREGKIKVLRKYDTERFRVFFQYLYSPRVIFDVEIPQYRPSTEPAGLNWTYMESEIVKLYRFIKDHPRRTNVPPEKLKSLLLVVLESLHKDEAEILVKLMKKDLGIPYLTPLMVEEAFPGINLS
jgi:hypothetical protein